jgi:hypothetical protein
VIDAQLAAIAFHRDDSNQVTLKIGLPVPGALRRAGNQQTLSNEAKSALAVMPGDLLHIGDWEIVFEESAKVP